MPKISTEDEIQLLVKHIESIKLEPIELGQEFYYPSLPLCVIDAVFSPRAPRESTEDTVQHFCKKQDWNISPTKHRIAGEKSISDFLECFSGLSPENAAETLFGNPRRTPGSSSILKAEAVQLFGGALLQAGINDFPDLTTERLAKARANILKIKGIGEGTLDNFGMLAGNDNLTQPSSRVKRFIAKALNIGKKQIEDNQARFLVKGAVEMLNKQGKSWSPRRLDYAIWKSEENAGE